MGRFFVYSLLPATEDLGDQAQQMVWLEGRHLPQDIALSDRAVGVELVR